MLLACGSNGRGQLGLAHDQDVSEWTPVDIELCGPIHVAGGGNHTVLLERYSGKAYISGSDGFTPITHPQGRPWKLCSAGWAFTILVDSANVVWAQGAGSKGELGLGPAHSSGLASLDWIPPAEIVDLQCGMAHTVVCLADKTLWGWGASRKGQLNCAQPVVDRPILVMDGVDPETRSYACGRDFTAVLKDLELRILGSVRWLEPKRIDASNDDTVLAGWSSVLLLPSGRMFGNNSHGQLDKPPGSETVVLGSEHGISRAGNSVATWGWGEHGNCPESLTVEGNVQLFAGCATSFIYRM